MVIYEVNIQINIKIRDIFLSWLKSHAIEMLKFDGFKRYDIYEDEKDSLSFTIHYHIENINYLKKYLKDSSSDMRNKGKENFQNQINIDRRILLKL
tara:strand:+ start:33 stop:320 length:288 start_codon:yes stop_codon:yes gene_type:complete